MTLSIIIPYYNAEPYTTELLDILEPQITEEVEILLVDDGSKVPFKNGRSWLTVFRKENGGPASARNYGLSCARGNYVSFIDADDMVPEYYVEKLIETINRTKADVIDFSWMSLDNSGSHYNYKLNSDEDYLPNPSVCTRCFKREFIGQNRFNENKDATEDEDFSRKVGYLEEGDFVHCVITDYMYFYRTTVPNSNVKNFKAGLTRTKRVIYHYPIVSSEMTWLLDQIKEDDRFNEVVLMTDKCDIPELKRYCTIEKTTHKTWGHYLKGEQNGRVNIIPIPHRTEVVLYANSMDLISGIATFVRHFATVIDKDITYVVNKAPKEHIEYMSRFVTTINDPERKIICDTLIMLRLADELPGNIEYKKSIQTCHACKYRDGLHIPQDRDYLVNVSYASKKSFKQEAQDGVVIHNLISMQNEKPLILVSATRLPASDKGDCEKRMRQLCDMLNAARIDFIWLNFSDGQMVDPPKNFINMGPKMNASKYFSMATYVVQLSSNEAWSYTILEALTQNVPVLICDFPSAHEMEVGDGHNGYILPFDMKFDVNRILEVPVFDYQYDNDLMIRQWNKILNAKPPKRKMERVRVIHKKYHDIKLNRMLRAGDIVEMLPARAKYLQEHGFVEIIE